jgi:hypothetical protein
MKILKPCLLIFLILISYSTLAQDKTVSKEKDTIGETKISPIVQPMPVQPTKVIICGPSRSSLIQILYVVDGKIIDQKKMNQINPNDIESMKVLKPNEGKLLYGDQGANGVITVTLKKK